jgi:two-component system response regulator PilR (NtrC family)
MPKHVLIVDDETTILIAFKKLLQSPGVEVDTAETFEEVEVFLNKQPYDAGIADLRLSGIAGEEGLDIIRYVKERNPDTQVILMTGYGNQDIMKKAYTLGAAYYFEKPVSTNIIRDALRSFGIINNISI